jgi:hypothetical protein
MHKPAGGIGSRNVTDRTVRTGDGARAVNTKFASRVGQSIGNKATEKRGTIPYVREDVYKPPNFNPVPQGNQVAASTQCGPGGSRNIYRSGGQHGLKSPRPMPGGRSIDD